MRARQAVALPVLLLLLLPLLAAPTTAAEPPPLPAASAAPAEPSPAPGHEAAPEAEAPPAPLQPALPAEIDDAITHLVHAMEEAEKSFTRMQDLGDDIGRLRDEVERVIARTTEVADGLRPRLAEVRSQIDRLGPAPGKEGPPEAAAVAAERARLHAEASALDGAIKTLELTWVRARQTIDKITDLRLAIFTRSLMEQMASPLLPSLWADVARDAPPLARLMGYISSDWWNSVNRQLSTVLLLLAGALVVYLGGKALAARVTRPAPGEACATRTFFERAAAAAWIAPLRTLPAVLAALVIYGGLDSLGLLYYPSASIAAAVLRAVLIFAAVATLIAAVLAPHEPQRRLVSLSDRSASRICRYLQAMTLVYAADLALTSVGRALYVPLSISVVQSLAASIAFAGLLVGLCLTPFEPYGTPGEAAVSRARPRWLKVPLWAAALGIIVACALGYVALGRFAAQQLEMTGVIGLAATLLFLAIRAFTREPSEAPHPVGLLLERRFGLDAPRRQQLARLTEFALTLTLGILALPLFMLQWGFSGDDIRDWLKAALFGFEIGQFRISLARILIGVVLFTALLFATRLVQRWLRDNVLSTRTDPGIANSIDTAVGYAGIAVAALLSISYAGFDVTNLAIVAGALSVGIGFGLQSIVNNFVSGLILLIERPIKVGDWIVVGNEQGNVRRISVRSTEIETFDRASLIVPNSELIAGRVLNWTHRNSMGRLVLKFNVCYSADARKAAAILLECARRHPAVMRTPAPKAVLEGLAEKWLEFSLRVYLTDINEALDVQSDLRMAALEALRAAGVDIPGAQPAAPITPPPELVKRAMIEPIDGLPGHAPGGAARLPELVRDKS